MPAMAATMSPLPTGEKKNLEQTENTGLKPMSDKKKEKSEGALFCSLL